MFQIRELTFAAEWLPEPEEEFGGGRQIRDASSPGEQEDLAADSQAAERR